MSEDQSTEALTALVNEIAEQLDERGHGPRLLIRSIITHCGEDFARQILQETMEIEEQGGMLTLEGDRRRTKGGVYFYIARGRLPEDAFRQVFPRRSQLRKKSPPAAFKLGFLKALIKDLSAEQGEISIMKVTLIGRPGKTEIQRNVTITVMKHEMGNASMPKGLPPLPKKPTLYTVYIGSKQWRRVEVALRNPQDSLIIEGICAYDPGIQMMTIYTTHATTRALEHEKRQQQKKAAAEAAGEEWVYEPFVGTPPPKAKEPESPNPAEESPAPAARAPAKPAAKAAAKLAEKPAAPPAPPPAPARDLPANITPDDAQKLNGLYAAADLYRQKIATITAKPENQRFGLEMTQKLLAKTEEDIAALEGKYA